MCGIAGLAFDDHRQRPDEDMLRSMADAMVRRGPDGAGIFVDGSLGLAHRRLAVIDPEGGVQPMRRSPDGPVIVYNGEIYNARELRADLTRRGVHFHTRSDTEVVLAAYEVYGHDAPSHLRGMFAFAIHDPGDRSLFLARDRLGIKPLYYCHRNGVFAFASELTPLKRLRRLDLQPSAAALRNLLLFQFIPGPDSFFDGALRLQPGHMLVLRRGRLEVRSYWKPGRRSLRGIGEREAVLHLRSLLLDTVERHMISDVPLGAFLSGGIDSSYLAACMQKVGKAPVETFTVSFRTVNRSYDESRWARLVADYLGTRHHEINIDETRLLEAVPDVMAAMDEPLADPALVPTYLLSRFARGRVKVALTGEGADELFGGYNRYVAHKWRSLISGPPRNYRPTRVFESGEVERLLTAEAKRKAAPTPLPRFLLPVEGGDLVNRLLHSELRTALPDNLLLKVDKMSMLASLEARVPYLDHRVVEYAMALPGRLKVRGLTLKHILKRAAADLLPPAILKRKKQGFTLPIAEWFQSTRLKEEARRLLADSRLVDSGLLDRGALNDFARTRLADPRYARRAWTLYTLELWLRTHL